MRDCYLPLLALLGLGFACDKSPADKTATETQQQAPAERTAPEEAPGENVEPAAAEKPDPAKSAPPNAENAEPPVEPPAPGGDGAGGGSGAGADKAGGGAPAAETGPPKNLKVLPKRWSRDQVTAYMKKEIRRGLGEKCDFCHDRTDFASDANKHKGMARDMITMTNSLNKRFFKGKPTITCFTCHKGKKEPEEP